MKGKRFYDKWYKELYWAIIEFYKRDRDRFLASVVITVVMFISIFYIIAGNDKLLLTAGILEIIFGIIFFFWVICFYGSK